MFCLNKKSGFKNSAVAVSLVALLSVAACNPKEHSNADGDVYKGTPVVANINGAPVYQAEADSIVGAVLNQGTQNVKFKDLDEKSKPLIIRELAAQRAMLKEASEKGIKSDVEVERKVVEFRNKLILDKLLVQVINPQLTKEKVQAKYTEIEKAVKGKQQFKVSHILLSSEDDAKKAQEALKKDPFAKVAKDMSKDNVTKANGGELGYVLSGAVDADFEKAAMALKIGEISAPVKSSFGWHIIRLEDKRSAAVPAFEALKPRIEQELYAEILKNHADSILKDVKIEVIASNEEKKENKAEGSKEAPKVDSPVKDEAKKSEENK